MTRPQVTAVTLNWNRPDDTLACLASLKEQTYPDLQLLVVDNGSTDDSAIRIRAEFSDVSLLAHPHNSGFARGNNLGIRQALAQGADYVFCLNNDTWLAPDAIERLVTAAAQETALLSPII
jgi:GT2 family glycosyltransferase